MDQLEEDLMLVDPEQLKRKQKKAFRKLMRTFTGGNNG